MARAMNTARTPLALYIHWPFCVSKCPYCDFNSHVRESVDQDAWRSAMLADLHYEADLLPGREVTITGQVDGHEDRKVGEYDYRYPRLAADVLFLWPERRRVDVIVERSPFFW